MAERSEGGKSRRGFASMDPSRQREIASKGGRAAHAKGTAHEFDSNEARAAGRKGGEAVSRNRDHMAAIGRKGGEARGTSARQAASRQSSARLNGDRETTRSSELGDIRGTASETVRGEQSRGGTQRGEQDRTQQLRSEDGLADQSRAGASREASRRFNEDRSVDNSSRM